MKARQIILKETTIQTQASFWENMSVIYEKKWRWVKNDCSQMWEMSTRGMKSWENIHPVKDISENKNSEELGPRHFNKKHTAVHDCVLFCTLSFCPQKYSKE